MELSKQANADYKNCRALIFELVKLKGFVIEPIVLGDIFYDYLQEMKPNNMNTQKARNMSKVFATLCHIFYIAGQRHNILSAFPVSPKIWGDLNIGRSALEESIKTLKEMALVEYYNWYPKGHPEQRKRYYKIDIPKFESIVKQAKKKERPKAAATDDIDLSFADDWAKFSGQKRKVSYDKIPEYKPKNSLLSMQAIIDKEKANADTKTEEDIV